MRGIKFRAWINEEKIMVDVWKIDFNIKQLIWGDDYEQVWENYFGGSKKNCELLQYTGLKDKNGTEIYEGDIITYANRRCEIIFLIEEGSFRASLKKNTEAEGTYLTFGLDIRSSAEYEVIGNIYETPELLEVVK